MQERAQRCDLISTVSKHIYHGKSAESYTVNLVNVLFLKQCHCTIHLNNL